MKHFFLSLVLVVMCQFLSASGPVAKNDSVTVHENSQINIAVTANDIDSSGGNLSVTISFPPINGSATANVNVVLYKPQQGFLGLDSFRYSVCDTFALCAAAEVYVLVQGSTLPPVVVNDSYTFADTVTTAVLAVLSNDTDPGHDTLYVASVFNIDSTSNLGWLVLDSASHQVVFIHNQFTCGTGVFQYLACNISKCDTGVVTVNVTCPDSIFLPQGFSPNGDGKNDLLVFRGLEYFTGATLNVFNRYGTSVFQSTDYLNNWDGTDGDSHHPLPDGTYFYVLKLPDGKTYNNYVIINR